jgi:hypothetical protein
MKKALMGIVALLAVVFAGPAWAQPKIEVREVKYDFGKVAQGTQVSHVFEVRNAGTESLIIERVQSS